ncbi:hypothetical protein [Lachnoclostridium sp. MSJ-17]|uniref:hypothetical protein n=1 Tax=Lachnoclostridium sp. MSJ-17 TaxID=2841516 RepID=UPI003FA57E0E
MCARNFPFSTATAKPSSTGSIIILKNNKDKWLFNTKQTDCSALPENTSLPKNVKNYLLSGGVIRNAYGRLR